MGHSCNAVLSLLSRVHNKHYYKLLLLLYTVQNSYKEYTYAQIKISR